MIDDHTQDAVAEGGRQAETLGDVVLPARDELVLDRYRIGRELGRGGQAVVFEAIDVQLDRSVALKILAPTFGSGSSGDWQGLLDEARLQAAVEAPGVARLLDAQQDGNRRLLVMELVPGNGLKEIIAELKDRRLGAGKRPASGLWLAEAAELEPGSPAFERLAGFTWDEAVCDFGFTLATSVAHLHGAGLIHRDLKPGNLKLDSEGRPVVLDFGLAHWLGASTGAETSGTPGYMAPEQLKAATGSGANATPPDVRTDVYQIGLILYELLTLERAYPAELLQNIKRYVEIGSAGSVRPVRERDGLANLGLAAIIDHALAPVATDRYASLDGLASDLRRAGKGAAPQHAATPAGYRARCAVRGALRSPIVAALLVGLLLAPIVWMVRASLVNEVTSLEGWSFSPETSSQQGVVTGSSVSVGDDLGLRIATSTTTHIYVFSVYGGVDSEGRFVSPMRPLPLVDGSPQLNEDPQWGVRLAPGEHELVCTRIVEPNPREGLLVFATPKPVLLLERWMDALDEQSSRMQAGVGQATAFALLDQQKVARQTRGGSVMASADEQQLADERLRYAGLSASKVAGNEQWDLGQDMVRFEFLCDVVQPSATWSNNDQ